MKLFLYNDLTFFFHSQQLRFWSQRKPPYRNWEAIQHIYELYPQAKQYLEWNSVITNLWTSQIKIKQSKISLDSTQLHSLINYIEFSLIFFRMFKFNFNQDPDPDLEEKKTEELSENLAKGYSIFIRKVNS